MTWMDKLGDLLQQQEEPPANLANPANRDSQGTPTPSSISQVSQISQPGGTSPAHAPQSSISQISQISQGGGVAPANEAQAPISQISRISQGSTDVETVLEQAAQGTEVSAALLRAALTDEDLEEIRRGRETAETLRGVAWALPETPGLLERAQRRLAEQQAEEPAEEPPPLETVAGITAADVARACRAFYSHVAQNCCNPAHGRYCAEGLRLKADYERASAACEAPPWRKGLSGASGTEDER